MQANLFSDIRIVELASVLAGPSVGMFFGELGARVVKVENKRTGGDVTRNWKGPLEDRQASFSAYYASVNFGKTVIELDLSLQEDLDQVFALINEADIVLTNFRKGAAEKFELTYNQLKIRKPDLIVGHISGFGEHSNRLAFDVVLQAEAGYLHMCGPAGGPVCKMPVALIDILAGHQLKEGLLCALLHRLKTGNGSLVQVSLLDAALSALANQATNWLMGGYIPESMGTQHPNIAPYGDVFFTSDQKGIVLATGTEKHFSVLCQTLGLENVLRDERFATNAMRVRNRSHLAAILKPQIVRWHRSTLLETLISEGVPAGAIRNMKEVFELSAAQSMLLHYNMPDGSQATCVRTVAFQWGE